MYDKCLIPVTRQSYSTLKQIFLQHDNIVLDKIQWKVPYEQIRMREGLYSKWGFPTLKLGYFGSNFLVDDSILLDENFYLQAQMSPESRWNNFDYPRSYEAEECAFSLLNCADGPYVFLHEDLGRGFSVQRERLPNGIRIIEPNLDKKKFNILAYRKVLEHASEIHCIESSFSIFADNLMLQNNLKFAHRYSRPEVLNDSKHAISYKTHWNILL
jgi:hypothetical protein